MKITKLAMSAALAAACLGGSVSAQTASNEFGSYSSNLTDKADYASVIPASCSCSDAPISGCCDDSCAVGCDDACDSAGCGLGAWSLCQGSPLGLTVGGWASIGYHQHNIPLFNQHADRVNLHQAWLYAEKVADGSDGIGFGGRIDYLYGVDAQDTQAFGQDRGWDAEWDNGIYGHALPQAYGEVAMGDLSLKVGHFYTLIGYEVVGAPGNFFYSHSYTMYNSEPFTHTGALAQYAVGDNLTAYGGWVMGWDSGFEDNGDAFLGGYSWDNGDGLTITNQMIVGRFGEGTRSEVGWMTSWILSKEVSDNFTYVLWYDFLDTDHGEGRAVERETFDLNQYFLFTLCDRVTWGNRLEWYNVDKGVFGVTDGRSDIYAYTTGFNIAASDNLLFRPEVRWDWDKDEIAGLDLGGSQTTFGADMVLTF